MTARIRDFLRSAPTKDRASCSTTRSCARTISLRQGAARHARVLRREGEPGAGDPDAACRARLVLRRRLGDRDRNGARGRLHAGPHLLRQHDQEGERDRHGAYTLGVTLFAIDCEAEVEKVARAAPGSRVICRIHCDGVGLGMAALAQVRLRAGLCGRHARARARSAASSPYGISFHVGSQQHNHRSLGPRARLDRVDLPRLRRARHHAQRWSISAAASRRSTWQDAEARRATARRSSARCAATSATPFRKRSSSRAAASSAMPA